MIHQDKQIKPDRSYQIG